MISKDMQDKINEIFDPSNQETIAKNKSLMRQDNQTDQIIWNFVRANNIMVPMRPLNERNNFYIVGHLALEIKIENNEPFVYSKIKDSYVPLILYLRPQLNKAMEQIVQAMINGNCNYSTAVDQTLQYDSNQAPNQSNKNSKPLENQPQNQGISQMYSANSIMQSSYLTPQKPKNQSSLADDNLSGIKGFTMQKPIHEQISDQITPQSSDQIQRSVHNVENQQANIDNYQRSSAFQQVPQNIMDRSKNESQTQSNEQMLQQQKSNQDTKMQDNSSILPSTAQYQNQQQQNTFGQNQMQQNPLGQSPQQFNPLGQSSYQYRFSQPGMQFNPLGQSSMQSNMLGQSSMQFSTFMSNQNKFNQNYGWQTQQQSLANKADEARDAPNSTNQNMLTRQNPPNMNQGFQNNQNNNQQQLGAITSLMTPQMQYNQLSQPTSHVSQSNSGQLSNVSQQNTKKQSGPNNSETPGNDIKIKAFTNLNNPKDYSESDDKKIKGFTNENNPKDDSKLDDMKIKGFTNENNPKDESISNQQKLLTSKPDTRDSQNNQIPSQSHLKPKYQDSGHAKQLPQNNNNKYQRDDPKKPHKPQENRTNKDNTQQKEQKDKQVQGHLKQSKPVAQPNLNENKKAQSDNHNRKEHKGDFFVSQNEKMRLSIGKEQLVSHYFTFPHVTNDTQVNLIHIYDWKVSWYVYEDVTHNYKMSRVPNSKVFYCHIMIEQDKEYKYKFEVKLSNSKLDRSMITLTTCFKDTQYFMHRGATKSQMNFSSL